MTVLAHAAGSGLTTVLALLTLLGWIAAIPIAKAIHRSPERPDRRRQP